MWLALTDTHSHGHYLLYQCFCVRCSPPHVRCRPLSLFLLCLDHFTCIQLYKMCYGSPVPLPTARHSLNICLHLLHNAPHQPTHVLSIAWLQIDTTLSGLLSLKCMSQMIFVHVLYRFNEMNEEAVLVCSTV